MADIPHLSLPFRFVGFPYKAAETEQDSIDEIADCVQAILRTEPGQRMGMPEFGIYEFAFRTAGEDNEHIKRTLRRLEPRADTIIEEGWDFSSFTQNLRIEVKGETDG
jgi:hypothetical protein